MNWLRNVQKLIRRLVDAAFADVHTHLPAQVISYNATENTCSILPCIKRIRTEDPNNMTTIPLPQIDDVPVKQFGSGKCLFAVAPQAGSYGVFHVAERSIDNWMNNGGIVEPSSARRFDLGDGFFDPGAYPLKADGDKGLVEIPIKTDRIELRTRTRAGYISLLDTDIVEINGTADFAVAYTDLKSAFDQLAGDFDNLVTAYNAHIHITTATVAATPTPGVIAPTTSSGTPTTADMSGAKVDTVKLP